MATVAQVLAQTLNEAGIEIVFGLPGGENAHVLDALRLQEIDFILVKSESSALYMADATARLTGKPAVALTTLGPGAASAYCGLAHDYLDRSPLLLITAQSDTRLLGRHTHQVLDLQAIFWPVTKMTREVTSVNTQALVQEALWLSSNGRPGPVHLGISSHVAGQTAKVQGEPWRHGAGPAETAPGELEEARALLARSQRPLIVAGVGLEPQRPYEALRELAESTSSPVVVTPKAKGALGEHHPLAAGVIGLTSDDPAYQIVCEADCLVAVGFDVVELVRPWEVDRPTIWVARPLEKSRPAPARNVPPAGGRHGPILERVGPGFCGGGPRLGCRACGCLSPGAGAGSLAAAGAGHAAAPDRTGPHAPPAGLLYLLDSRPPQASDNWPVSAKCCPLLAFMACSTASARSLK